MGFGGAQGMITSLKNNSRRNKREIFDGWTRSDKESQGIKVEPVSEEVLDHIRNKIQLQQKKSKKRNIVIAFISFIISILFFYVLILYFKNSPGVSWGPFSVLTP